MVVLLSRCRLRANSVRISPKGTAVIGAVLTSMSDACASAMPQARFDDGLQADKELADVRG